MSSIELLPEIMRESRYVQDVYRGLDIVEAEMEKAQEVLINNLFVDTADSHGLELWEKQFGIETIHGAADADRRAVIKAKLRGQGTCTGRHGQSNGGELCRVSGGNNRKARERNVRREVHGNSGRSAEYEGFYGGD